MDDFSSMAGGDQSNPMPSAPASQQPQQAQPPQGGGILKSLLSGLIIGGLHGMSQPTVGASAAAGSQAVLQANQQWTENQQKEQAGGREQQQLNMQRDQQDFMRKAQAANYNLEVYKTQQTRDRLDLDTRKEQNEEAAKSAGVFMTTLKDNPKAFAIADKSPDASHSETVMAALQQKGLGIGDVYMYHDPTSDKTLIVPTGDAAKVKLAGQAGALQSLYADTIKKHYPNATGPLFTPEMGLDQATPLTATLEKFATRDAEQQRAETMAVQKKAALENKPQDLATGTDTKGNEMAGTAAELKAAGVGNITKLPAADASKVSIARQLTSPTGLFSNVEKDLAAFKPEELSALAARWNEFQTGTLGSGDPRFAALRTDSGLLSTALMQAHVGSRGGEQMMEHFANLANAGKMNGEILKSAFATERRYVEEKAMRPGGAAVKPSKPATKADPLGIR